MKNKKRVLYVIHGYPPQQFAGTENYSYSFANEISKSIATVGVVYPRVKNTNTTEVITKKINNQVAFEIHKSYTNILDYLHNSELELIFAKIIEKFRPDIIHIQHTYTKFPLSILLVSKKYNIPSFITLHDFWYICPNTYMINHEETLCEGPTSSKKCAYCFLKSQDSTLNIDNNSLELLSALFQKRIDLARRIFSEANLVAAPTHYLISRYKKFIPLANYTKISLGLDTDQIKASKTHSSFPRFGFLGNITKIKNVHGLLNAFTKTTGNATLNIHGDIYDESIYKTKHIWKKSDPRIVFFEKFKPSNLHDILSKIDIGVLPSFFENYPLVLREFLCIGTPVIASRVGGIPEIITHNKNGILFDPNNQDELQSILQNIIDNKEIINKLRANKTKIKTIQQDILVWNDIYNYYYNKS